MENSLLDRPIPEILYHYCGADSFHNILDSHEIWLTNCRYFNDYGEVKHFEKLTKDYVAEKFPESPFKKAFLEKFRPSEMEYFVLCFSSESNSLSQWRGYADDGKGVNIGFNISSFNATDIFKQGFNFKLPFYIGPVIYDSSIALKLIENYLGDFEELSKPNPPAVEALSYLLSCLAIFYKEQHFKEEREYRLVYIPNTKIFTDVGLEDVLPDFLQEQRFHTLKGAVVPLRSYSLKRKNDDEIIKNRFIAEVGLGPRCRTQQRDLIGIFIKYGFKMPLPRINESQITYGG